MRRLLQAVVVATFSLASGTTADAEQLHHTANAAIGVGTSVPDPAAASETADGQSAVVLVPGVPTPGGCMMPMMAMMGKGGMGMMGSMMPMMGGGAGMAAQGMAGGRAQPGMLGMGAQGMGPGTGVDRIEGRLAFVRAEVGISEAQGVAWDAFVEAVRSAVRPAGKPAAGVPDGGAAPTLAQRLETQDAQLGGRLDDVRAMRAALAKLYEVLTEDQRAAAEMLIPEMLGAVVLG